LVPAAVLIVGVDQATAQGTSLLVILPTALAGAYAHFRRRSVVLNPTWLVGLAGAAAAIVGSLVAVHINGSTLRVLFAIFLLLVGLREIFSRSRPPT
jgi:uncharacterized membrane protein YfcA